MNQSCRGDLPSVIRNSAGLYEGSLEHYFQAIFHHAQNVRHPYHNFRHMTHVAWLCHDACRFYRESLTSRQMRHLLIAALFHDFNHSGTSGDDDLNIKRAIRGLEKHILSGDRLYLLEIGELIEITQFPYTVESTHLGLRALILRDADVSQALSVAWIQQIVFGLAAEWGKSPSEVLAIQEPFLSQVKFHTEWAQQRFPQVDIQAKVQEAQELVELLNVRWQPTV